jgi:hypothetical protein
LLIFTTSVLLKELSNTSFYFTRRHVPGHWGVTPEVALYVVRYCLANPIARSVLTISHRLLQRGIPFRTFISFPSHSMDKSISKRFIQQLFRTSGHPFTLDDFDSAWLQCKAVSTSPQGGLVGGLAREYLSQDAVLDGSSIQVKRHRGDVYKSTRLGHSYWDDSLTQDEIGTI